MLGSWAYVRAHQAELDGMAAAIIFDSGDGRMKGYSLSGRKDILAAVREALKPVSSLNVQELASDVDARSDNLDFLLEGVPTLVAVQDPVDYILHYHAASDTFDKVNIAELKRHVAAAAVTAYALADREQLLGTRQSRAEVEQLLKETGLDQNMKLEGFWPMWDKGNRGHEP